MKTKAILAFVVAGALSFSACTKKIDPKTVADINQFGTDWTTLGESATNWSTELAATTTQTKEFIAKQTERMNTLTSPKDAAVKEQVSKSIASATETSTKLEGMQNEFNTFKATWDETTKQFGELKDKVTKGEVTAEDATKGLAEFQAKLAEAKSKFEGWSAQYAEVKTATEQNMASIEPATTPEPTPAQK
jgi:chromosome segregation ATPase